MREPAAAIDAVEKRPISFDPIIVNRASRSARFPLKVASINLYGRGRIDEIAECLSSPPVRGAGVILLCEAGWRTRRAGRREVAAELAGRLGMSFAFAPCIGFPGLDGTFNTFSGSAILSAEPLHNVTTALIPIPERTARRRGRVARPAGLFASVVIGGRAITAGVVHLDRNSPPHFRARQLAEYLATIPREGLAVIAGDFNTTTIDWTGPHSILKVAALMALQPRRFRHPIPHEPLFERLSEAAFEIEGTNVALKPTFTFTRFIPQMLRPKLDWIAARGLRPVAGSAKVVAPRVSILKQRASDHDLILCELIP